MNILVIDDEIKARSLLKNLIQSSSFEIDNIYEAEDLSKGVSIIKEESPKLVFLDIEMPNEQGTEIFKYFDENEVDFELVFTTAYSEYALQAFEMNAVDYLLKPIRPKRLKEVIERVQKSFKKEDIQMRLEELKCTLKTNNFKKIGLPVQDGFQFVPLEEIVHLEADGMYTKVKKQDGKSIMVSKPLRFFQHLLDSKTTFYRPHRSHIVNLTFLKQYVRKDGSYIVMENEDIVPVSKDKKEEFLDLVSSI